MGDISLLPKSLIIDSQNEKSNPKNVIPSTFNQHFGYDCNNRLDEQLTILRKEMTCLKQLDLSLLSQLNVLRESILEYKKIIFDTDGDVANRRDFYFHSKEFNSSQSHSNSEDEITGEERDTSSESKV